MRQLGSINIYSYHQYTVRQFKICTSAHASLHLHEKQCRKLTCGGDVTACARDLGDAIDGGGGEPMRAAASTSDDFRRRLSLDSDVRCLRFLDNAAEDDDDDAWMTSCSSSCPHETQG